MKPIIFAGPRSVILVTLAYSEEGLPLPQIDESVQPIRLLYPRSYVQNVEKIDALKIAHQIFLSRNGSNYYHLDGSAGGFFFDEATDAALRAALGPQERPPGPRFAPAPPAVERRSSDSTPRVPSPGAGAPTAVGARTSGRGPSPATRSRP